MCVCVYLSICAWDLSVSVGLCVRVSICLRVCVFICLCVCAFLQVCVSLFYRALLQKRPIICVSLLCVCPLVCLRILTGYVCVCVSLCVYLHVLIVTSATPPANNSTRKHTPSPHFLSDHNIRRTSRKPSGITCVAVCCSVLQCVAVCCSVSQCVAVCCSELYPFTPLPFRSQH